jgi:hypothetical protein
MKVGFLLWLLAVAVAVIVGLAKFAGISVPVATPLLMKDSTLSLFVALGMSIVARWL